MTNLIIDYSKGTILQPSIFTPFVLLKKIICAFASGLALNSCISRTQCNQADKLLRDNLSEKQVDKLVEDSFPASDPPSTY